MIELYSGTPGSGKSLHTADRIIWALRTGKHIVSNFEINQKYIKGKKQGHFLYVPNDELSPDLLIDYATSLFPGKPREGSIILVIDECQLLFNAREWDKKGREKWTSFFTQHRKFGYDVILVAQFDRMIDRQIRSLIEYEYIHRKVSNYGFKGLFLQVAMLSPNLFVSVKMWYPLKERISSEFFRYRRSRSNLYDTYKSFKSV